MNLKVIMLSEKSRIQKVTYYMIPFKKTSSIGIRKQAVARLGKNGNSCLTCTQFHFGMMKMF